MMETYNENGIKERLARHGFKFSKSMGQNFLVDPGVPEKIARLSGIDKSFAVLEVGPGIGPLTAELCKAAERVVAVELDRSLLPILEETLAGYDNVEIVTGDILKLDIKALAAEKMAGYRRAVCANLPYNITTPALTALIGAGVFETITVMMQREVAQRVCAAAGSSDYGAITVFVNYHAKPEILFDVRPECFVPRPRVVSSVVKLNMRPAPLLPEREEAMFFRVVKASFAQRRKTLVNALHASFGYKLTKDDITAVISDCGYNPMVRGETLDIQGFMRVAAALGSRL